MNANDKKKIAKINEVLEGGAQGLSVLSNITIGALKIAPLPMSRAALALQITNSLSSGFFGIGFFAGVATDVYTLYQLWNCKGRYAKLAEEASEYFIDIGFKQRKKTAYLLIERALMLGILLAQILTTAGVLAAGSMVMPAFAVTFVVFNITKAIYSLVRIRYEYVENQKELAHLMQTGTNSERVKLLLRRQGELKYKMFNNINKMSMILMISAISVTLTLTAGPLAGLLIPIAVVLMVGVQILYDNKIKPKIKERQIDKAMQAGEDMLKAYENSANNDSDNPGINDKEGLIVKKPFIQKEYKRRPLYWLNKEQPAAQAREQALAIPVEMDGQGENKTRSLSFS